MAALTGPIEESVEMTRTYPSVTDRYFTKYYYIPKEGKKQENITGDEQIGHVNRSTYEGGEDLTVGKQKNHPNRSTCEEGEDLTEGKQKNRSTCEDGEDLTEGKQKTHPNRSTHEEGRDLTGGKQKIHPNRSTYEEGEDLTVDKQKTHPNRNTYEEDCKKDEMKDGCNEGAEMKEEDCKKEGELKDSCKMENDVKESRINSPGESAEGDSRRGHGPRSALDSTGHTCIMIHTNKLCLITLSPRHPILALKKEVIQVGYEVGKFNRLENQVSGKGKRGAQMLGPQSPVCIISCADGSRYAIMAGVHGKLIEVNERLLTNPKLVSERPDAEGYLAVVLPPLRTIDNATARLLPHKEYQALQ